MKEITVKSLTLEPITTIIGLIIVFNALFNENYSPSLEYEDEEEEYLKLFGAYRYVVGVVAWLCIIVSIVVKRL